MALLLYHFAEVVLNLLKNHIVEGKVPQNSSDDPAPVEISQEKSSNKLEYFDIDTTSSYPLQEESLITNQIDPSQKRYTSVADIGTDLGQVAQSNLEITKNILSVNNVNFLTDSDDSIQEFNSSFDKSSSKSLKYSSEDKLSIDITHVKNSIQLNLVFLTRNIGTGTDLCLSLLAQNVLSVEESEQLECIGKQCGLTAKITQLLKYILIPGKKDDEILKFLKIVKKEEQQYVYEKIWEDAKKIECGEIAVSSSVIKDLQEEMCEVYKSKNINEIKELPCEHFILDLNEKQVLMPFNFKVEVKTINETQLKFMKEEHCDYEYQEKNCNSFEDLLSEMKENDCARLLLCTGQAGMGKSVLIQSLVWQWLDKNSHLNKEFSAVFAIILRNIIDVRAPLIELLGRSRTGIGYLSEKLLDSLQRENFLNGDDAKNILVLMDGADEVDLPDDCELFQLLTGKVYPKLKVVVTARPEAVILKKMSNVFPYFKVTLLGTTDKGVYNYLNLCLESISDTKSIDGLLTQCENSRINFDLLKVPLYLKLITIVFSEHLSRKSSFADFNMPRTITELFNAFFTVILRRWIEKLDKFNTASEVKIDRSPLDPKKKKVPTATLR